MSVGVAILIIALFGLCILGFCWVLRIRWLHKQRLVLSEERSLLMDSADFTLNLIENSPYGIFVIDEDFTAVLVNETYCRMTGRKKEEFIGQRPPFPGWTPEKRKVIEEYMKRAQKGEIDSFEIPVVRKDNTRFPALFSTGSMTTKQGKKFYFGNVKDLTEQKLSETALQQSEETLRTAVDSLPFEFFMLDKNGRYVMANQEIKKRWGDILGKRPEDIGIDEKTLSKWAENNVRAFAGETVEGEISFSIDGEERIYHDIVSPVYGGDEVRGVMGINIDITRLVETERSLRTKDISLQMILDQLPSIFWGLDRDLRTTVSIGSSLKMGNLKPGELVGKTLYEYFNTDDEDSLPIAMHRKALAGEKVSFEAEWGGGFMDIRIEPLRDEQGQIVGCLGVAYDITKRKRAEEEAAQSREQLRALAGRLHEVREKESAGIAREIHDELGQTLTGLRWDLSRIGKKLGGYGNTIGLAPIRQKIKEMTGDIDAAVKRVREISTQLRPPILDDLGLAGAIEWQTEVFQKRTGIECKIHKLGVDDADLRLDLPRSTSAFRIFQEILTNVGRHAEADNVEIEMQNHDDNFSIEVRDDGKGMPDDDGNARKGLGILGMRERALVFGGEVMVSSESGKGTSVRVVIPK